MKVSQAADRFITERSRLGEIRGRTPSGYRKILRTFAHDLDDPQVDSVTTPQIRRWAEHRDVRPNTIRANLIAIRSFFTWAVRARLCRTNPAIGVAAPKVPRGIPRAMRDDEVAQLIHACSSPRLRAVAFLMTHEGLRVAEICALTTWDIDVARRLIHVTGKGLKERIVPISDESWSAIIEYGLGAGGPLIRSKRDPRSGVTPGHLGRRMSDLFRTAGLKHHAWDGKSGHALRHTAAINTLRDGASPAEVRDLLGHSSLAITDIYTRAAGNMDRLREVMSVRHYV